MKRSGKTLWYRSTGLTAIYLALGLGLWGCATGEDGEIPNLDARDDTTGIDAGVDTQTFPYCGDGVRDPGEECDDGNNFDGDGCSSVCTLVEVCGDGFLDRGEECDDGNLNDGDGCSHLCERESAGTECGNGIAERGEQCDGSDMAGESCVSQGFSGGVLSCEINCKIDTSGCVTGSGCGNGVVDGEEDCDGTNLDHQTCVGLSFSGGTLGCTGECSFDTTYCTSESSNCGNGVVDRGETCDGRALQGQTCSSQGFAGGTLTCRADCNGFVTEGCTSGARCGDGVINGTENCDGRDLNHVTCTDLGFERGTLECGDDCTFDTKFCESGTGGRCGDGTIDEGEVCDGVSLGGETCESQEFASGRLACSADCLTFDTTRCASVTVPAEWTCPPDFYNAADGCDCGCGALDPDCADNTLASCEFCGNDGACNTGPCPGTINPTDNPTCDSSVGVCGDGLIGSGEACDGENLNEATCETQGFTGGTLACAVNCLSFDTSACTGSTVPGEWACDATYYGTGDGCDCGCGAVDPDCADNTAESCVYCDNTGSCTSDLCPANIDPTNNAICVAAGVCGDGAIGAGETCDGANLGEATCESLGHEAGTLACAPDCKAYDTTGCGGGGTPAEWACDPQWYGDGEACDCGCGAFDTDCADATADSCVWCAEPGSCNDTACPGNIDPTSNWLCLGISEDCGNGSIDAGEICDGVNLNGESCSTQGYTDGTLTCASTCRAFDTSACTGSTAPEGWTCSPEYYDEQVSAPGCDCECGAYDPDCDDPESTVWNCYPGQTCDTAGLCAGTGGDDCGNGTIEEGEMCDGADLNGQDCTDHSFTGGTLACSADCLAFVTTGCTGSTVPAGWLCNAEYYNASDGCDCECGVYDPDCEDTGQPLYGCSEGETCGSDGHCTGGGSADCGNGAIDAGETCDGANLSDQTCETQGYAGGTLVCATNCLSYDTSGCTGGCDAPEGWDEEVCPCSYYGDGEYCDCACGAYDSDCGNPDLPVDGCLTGQTCDLSGNCTGGSDIPSEWTCEAQYYNDGNGCDCACGAYDPDCADPEQDIYNCYPGQTCNTSGVCEGGSTADCGNGAIDDGEACDGALLNGQDCTNHGFTGGTLACASDCVSFDTTSCTGGGVPSEWTCNADYYGASDGCDCNCGAYDPDCSDSEATLYGCEDGQTCDSSGNCVGGGGDGPPAGWTCEDNYYNDGAGCDCECGAYDPDCSDSSQDIYNCYPGETCDTSGNCVAGGGGDSPPDGWTCDAGYYGEGTGCDCECGAYDPDCANSSLAIYGCYEGQSCDTSGHCQD